MSDLISRQAAIDTLFELYEYQSDIDPTEAADLVRQGIYLAEKKIEQLPSAQPERKKGEWIIEDDPRSEWYRVTCSECGEDVTSTVPMIGFFPNAKVLWDFCPNCGAEMEVDEDG